MRTCKCGQIFTTAPLNSRFNYDPDGLFSGWYWECQCGSTLTMPNAYKSEGARLYGAEVADDMENKMKLLGHGRLDSATSILNSKPGWFKQTQEGEYLLWVIKTELRLQGTAVDSP